MWARRPCRSAGNILASACSGPRGCLGWRIARDVQQTWPRASGLDCLCGHGVDRVVGGSPGFLPKVRGTLWRRQSRLARPGTDRRISIVLIAEMVRFDGSGNATTNIALAILAIIYAGGLMGFLVQLRWILYEADAGSGHERDWAMHMFLGHHHHRENQRHRAVRRRPRYRSAQTRTTDQPRKDLGRCHRRSAPREHCRRAR